VRFVALGVRGSTAAPGADFLRYGGHTSSLAVFADGEQTPQVVLDAGTGVRDLSRLLGGAPYCGDVVLTHLHWDHVQGLPFCSSIDHPDARVRLFVPVADDSADPAEALSGLMSAPYFPIGPDGLLGRWQFEALRTGRLDDRLTVAAVPHKGSETFGVRVTLDDVSLCYLPDHALHAATDPTAVSATENFVRGTQVLIHDGQFVAAEEAIAQAYGHATIEATMAFADRAEVGTLVLTHHAPARTDDALDELAARYPTTPGGRPIAFLEQGRDWEVMR
jgi:ribonuclease BN (tRNA processing enzyme)